MLKYLKLSDGYVVLQVQGKHWIAWTLKEEDAIQVDTWSFNWSTCSFDIVASRQSATLA